MKKIVLTPNPYRDRNFKYVTLADKLLREAGLETRICLAFDVDRSFELPDNVVLTELNHELRDADLLVCFGGDGTILHASKAATKAGKKSPYSIISHLFLLDSSNNLLRFQTANMRLHLAHNPYKHSMYNIRLVSCKYPPCKILYLINDCWLDYLLPSLLPF